MDYESGSDEVYDHTAALDDGEHLNEKPIGELMDQLEQTEASYKFEARGTHGSLDTRVRGETVEEETGYEENDFVIDDNPLVREAKKKGIDRIELN
ncbi:MAG: hypothetical protein H8Z69_04755 [Nanohaloarchaea archaeon]|nr:hypothetical protein [Candidatus Nanohaloarchaea archaeon]